jgi:sugar lactone lactonase YvrE
MRDLMPTPTEITARAVALYEPPGGGVFPESSGVDAPTGDAYAGRLAGGTLYQLTGAGEVKLWSAGAQGGRGSVAGVKVDAGRRLRAAAGNDGMLWVYDVPGRELTRMDAGSRPSCVNDIAFGPHGEACVTDSLVTAGLIEFEVMELDPFTPLDVLFSDQPPARGGVKRRRFA